jgi:hypothetical protein
MQWQDPQGERVIKLNNGLNIELVSIKEGIYGKLSSCGDVCISKQGGKFKVDEKENT